MHTLVHMFAAGKVQARIYKASAAEQGIIKKHMLDLPAAS